MAENIRQAILDYRFTWEQTTSSIGASIGVVEITQETESVANLLSAADIACYAAKDSGRNRVHLYNSSEVSGRHREMYWVSRVTRRWTRDAWNCITSDRCHRLRGTAIAGGLRAAGAPAGDEASW